MKSVEKKRLHTNPDSEVTKRAKKYDKAMKERYNFKVGALFQPGKRK